MEKKHIHVVDNCPFSVFLLLSFRFNSNWSWRVANRLISWNVKWRRFNKIELNDFNRANGKGNVEKIKKKQKKKIWAHFTPMDSLNAMQLLWWSIPLLTINVMPSSDTSYGEQNKKSTQKETKRKRNSRQYFITDVNSIWFLCEFASNASIGRHVKTKSHS